MNELLNAALVGAGLGNLWTGLRDNWLGPLFLGAVAIFAIMFIKDRAWTKLIAFVGIAAIVGVLIFAGAQLFGPNGSLTKVAGDVAGQINMIVLPFLH